MGRYLLRRLIWMPFVLLLIVTASYFLVRTSDGDPFANERALPQEVRDNLQAKYGLDKPLFVQYLNYVKNAAQGDLGPSIKRKDVSVNEILAAHIGPSAVLGAAATVLALALGLFAGIIGAVRQNSWLDYSTMSVAMFGMSVPNFVTGPLLVLGFALSLRWLPVAGYEVGWSWWPVAALGGLYLAWRAVEWSRSGWPGSANFDSGHEIASFWIGLLVASTCLIVLLLFQNETLVLPSIVLALPLASRIARLMRAGMLEVVHQDYIRTARAKGLTETTVVLRHALKGGLVPVVSFLGPALAGLLTGSLVVEKIFNVPGIGREFVESALNRDYWLALGTVVLFGTILVVLNLIVDIAYGFLDPRVRYD